MSRTLAKGICLLACGLLSFSQACRPRSDELTEFDIGMVTFAGYAPLYLARDLGYFEPLNVRLHRIDEIASLRAGMRGKQLEAYLATLDIFRDSVERPPGVGVWAIDESSGGDGVVVREGLSKLSELRGGLVAAEPGLPPYFLLLYLLNEEGLGLSDLRFQDLSTQNASTAFVSGAVDAAALYEPYLTLAKTQRPGSQVVVSSADVPGLIIDLIFVREDIVHDHAESVKQIIQGWNDALQYVTDHPDDAYSRMASAFGLSEEEFKEIASGITWLGYEENEALFQGTDSKSLIGERFDLVGDILKRNREIVFQAEAEEFLTDQFVSPEE